MTVSLDRQECRRRLEGIFPAHLVADRRVAGAQAGAAVFVCLYVGAIDGDNPIRPTTVLWMCDTAAGRTGPEDRRAWYDAALRSRRDVAQLIASWGASHTPWYADNSCEPLRDEVFRLWSQLGALVRDESRPTTSSAPTWSLTGDFAALFDPALDDGALADSIAAWQDAHLGTVGRARAAIARKREASKHAVTITAPGGEITEQRRTDLLRWATERDIPADACRFLNASLSRMEPIFRSRVANLAWGSLVWSLDEPGHIARLEDLSERDEPFDVSRVVDV